MKYEIVYDIIFIFFGVMFSGDLIYAGIRQIKRVPFVTRGRSSRAKKVLAIGIFIFSLNTFREKVNMYFLVITSCLLILFLIFLYIDYKDNKKYYFLHVFNIEKKLLECFGEYYFKDKNCEIEIIDSTDGFNSIDNTIRINKSKLTEDIGDFKRNFEKYISHIKCEKFRVSGVFDILLGVGIIYLCLKLILG